MRVIVAIFKYPFNTVTKSLIDKALFFFLLQINAEFVRITSKNLKQDFFTALDQHTARFLKIFETKKGAVGKRLSEFLDQIKLKVSLSLLLS